MDPAAVLESIHEVEKVGSHGAPHLGAGRAERRQRALAAAYPDESSAGTSRVVESAKTAPSLNGSREQLVAIAACQSAR